MNKTKKIRIVVDNYKIPKFIEELTNKGFECGAIHPTTKETSSITLTVDEDKVEEVGKLCSLLEHQFKSN